MNAIQLVTPFDVIHAHSHEMIQVSAAEHMKSNLPLRFKLLDSPSWLMLNEQGLVSGIVPVIEHEVQLSVTLVAWNADDLLSVTLVMHVLPNSMFDSLKDPLLTLSMVNKPQFPREHLNNTREVLTYIFGYYHTKPQGEQFFEKLREKANSLNKHLPAEVTLVEFVSLIESLVPEEQREVLEFSVGKELLAELDLGLLEHAEAAHSPHLTANHAAMHTQHLEPERSASSEDLPEFEEIHGRSHILLKHLYAYLKATRPKEELSHFIHNFSEKKGMSLQGETELERFQELVLEAEPEAEKKLETLALKFPGFKNLKLSDQELESCYVGKELKEDRRQIEHIVFCFEQELVDEKTEALLKHLEKELIAYRQAHPLNRLEASHLHFSPTPFLSRE